MYNLMGFVRYIQVFVILAQLLIFVKANLCYHSRFGCVPMSTHSKALDFAKVNYLTLDEAQDGQRLDNFLIKLLKGVPKSHIYRMIRADEVRINKKRARPQDRLASGDVVRLAPVVVANRATPIVSDALADALKARIFYEDVGILALDKPAGLAVHGGSGVSLGAIESLRVVLGKTYLELIHRIDKQTSGVLLIAKKRSALKRAQAAFANKMVQKSYVCLVRGHMPLEKSTICAPLIRYLLPSGERRVAVHVPQSAQYIEAQKPATTNITPLAHLMLNGVPATLVRCYPKTGRTHQIRVHLAHLGYGLLGDDKYGHLLECVPRLMLHAHALWFLEEDAPTSKRLIAPMPEDFLRVIAQDKDGAPGVFKILGDAL